jgi:arylsulfatase A
VCGVDLLPTLCEIVGIQPPQDRAIDGASILPILAGRPIRRETPLYWQFNWARSDPKVAMRIGDWKLLADLTGPDLKPGADLVPEEMRAIKEAELTGFELYNLAHDIGETTDLAEKHPERLARMSAVLRRLYHEVRDESPIWPAWEWPRYESKRIIWKLDPPPLP